jgi:hypothetical protein
MLQVRKGYVVHYGQKYWWGGETLPPSLENVIMKNQSWKLEVMLDGKGANNGKPKELKEQSKEEKDKQEKERQTTLANIIPNKMMAEAQVKVK